MPGAHALRVSFAVAALLLADATRAEDGCVDGSFSVVPAPDRHAVSVLFDDFSVRVDNTPMTDVGSGTIRRCKLSIPLRTAVDSVALYHADYRGFALLGAGQSSSLVVVHANGRDQANTLGPYEGDTAFEHLLASDAAGALTADVLLTLQVAANQEPAIAVLDSIDFAELTFTSRASVAESIDAVAHERVVALNHLNTTADLALGFGHAVDEPSGIAAIAATGSTTLGVNARWRSDFGLTLLAGVSYVRLTPSDVSVHAPALLALAARYTDPTLRTLRPFFETGLWGVRDLELRSNRAYLNGTAQRQEDGSTAGAYVRAGAIHAPSEGSELAVAVTLSQDWLHIDGSTEVMTLAGNPFPLSTASRTSSPRAAKIGVTWTGILADSMDYTVAVAGGRAFADDDALSGNVAWIGKFSARPMDFNFLEYALRIGWRYSTATTLDLFVIGTRGEGSGAEAQIGAGWRLWL